MLSLQTVKQVWEKTSWMFRTGDALCSEPSSEKEWLKRAKLKNQSGTEISRTFCTGGAVHGLPGC